jgi:ribulose-5-phosphate 4-epimerase/fuculose-1-phosphate aldolase
MSAGYYGKREKLYLDDLHWALITSSHILHNHGIFDAYGHVSVRNPDNLDHFLMPRNTPPALISSVDDIVEYKIEDASPVEKDAPAGYGERCIHSEIYKKFPGVNAVLHCHATDVLPFTISEVPLKACIHTAGFLGTNFLYLLSIGLD